MRHSYTCPVSRAVTREVTRAGTYSERTEWCECAERSEKCDCCSWLGYDSDELSEEMDVLRSGRWEVLAEREVAGGSDSADSMRVSTDCEPAREPRDVRDSRTSRASRGGSWPARAAAGVPSSRPCDPARCTAGPGGSPASCSALPPCPAACPPAAAGRYAPTGTVIDDTNVCGCGDGESVVLLPMRCSRVPNPFVVSGAELRLCGL